MTKLDLNVKLHPRQYDVFNDVARFIVLVAGRRFGKTTLAVNKLFISALTTPKSINWYIAPTYKQAKMIAWKMLCEVVPIDLRKATNQSELSMTLHNGSIIELKGCDNPDSLRGAGVNFVVVDEFAIIPDAMDLWGAVLRPLLTDTKGKALFIGTPKGLNSFHDLYQKGLHNEDGFKSYLFQSIENPYIDPAEIKMAESGTLPAIFAQEYLCSFLASNESVLIKLQDIENLKGVQHYRDGIRRIISCDPSQGGDECVIYVLENTKIKEQMILHYDDTMKIVGELMVLSNKYYCDDFAVDTIGIGKGICDRLSELRKRVIEINSAEKATNELQHNNRRTEMWWYLMEQIQQREIDYFTDNELKRQLSNAQIKVSDSRGQVGLEPKKNTKGRLGCSPDRADAFVYGQWGLQFIKTQDYTPAQVDYNRRQEEIRNPLYEEMVTAMSGQTSKSDYEA
jgi:hypothetical protein